MAERLLKPAARFEKQANAENLDEKHVYLLEDVLSSWPILTSLAKHTQAGDLISLARTSSTLRAVTHGYPLSTEPHPGRLHIADHETVQWANLKSLATFVCSSPSHKEPKIDSTQVDATTSNKNITRPCHFCSAPICRTCLIRSFFADTSAAKQTFPSRTRYLCERCWKTGNLRKDFRHHPVSVSREQVFHGRHYAERGGICRCTASEDNWICGRCRPIQNAGAADNLSFLQLAKGSGLQSAKAGKQKAAEHADASLPRTHVQCYGLNCTNTITDLHRDRRRICLWCSKPLPRQYGGEDRLKWEEKQLSIRAAHAASRSADIEEWARNRFRQLTMSRRQMRGTQKCYEDFGGDVDHDERIFVRHLDAVNYRKWWTEDSSPSGQDVWNSKHGLWKYSSPFLTTFERQISRNDHKLGRHDRSTKAPTNNAKWQKLLPENVSADYLTRTTHENQSSSARLNQNVGVPYAPPALQQIERLASRLIEAKLITLKDQDDHLLNRRNWSADWQVVLDALYDELVAYEALEDDDQLMWKPTVTFTTVCKAIDLPTLVKQADDSGPDQSKSVQNASIPRLSGSRPTYEQAVLPPPTGAEVFSDTSESQSRLQDEEDGEEGSQKDWDCSSADGVEEGVATPCTFSSASDDGGEGSSRPASLLHESSHPVRDFRPNDD